MLSRRNIPVTRVLRQTQKYDEQCTSQDFAGRYHFTDDTAMARSVADALVQESARKDKAEDGNVAGVRKVRS